MCGKRQTFETEGCDCKGLLTKIYYKVDPMRLRALARVLLTGTVIFFQGCNDEEGVYELFSGTVPRLEIRNGEQYSYTDPLSLFLTMKGDAVEVEGHVYSIKATSSGEDSINYSAHVPLNDDLSISQLTYLKAEEKLLLRIPGIDRTVTLETFASMIKRKVNDYAGVDLTADLSQLSANQRTLLSLLFQVAGIMEDIYWKEVFPDRDAALASMVDENVSRFFKINYGPWERLNGNLPYLPGYGVKPAGSGFYPADMTIQEFESLSDPDKKSMYTLIVREQDGALQVVPYHEAYAEHVQQAADLLRQASGLAENRGFKKYLALRADALLTDNYYASDMAWMDMKGNDIDFVAGPIENYEDALFNYKAAHESFVLIKDRTWSERLAYIGPALPGIQKRLPVPDEYKKEIPGGKTDLGVYDVIYCTGDCNAGSKTIAINLPNNEHVQAIKGTRNLQLKNAIRSKFEKVLLPISNILIAEDQREHVTFDAFFENTMYHEVAHELGLKRTINGKESVRMALKEQYSSVEEGKADILALFLVTSMYEEGMLGEHDLMDNYVTFMASTFRRIRFGVASPHGIANMIRFYYFQELGAFSRDLNGTYSVNFEEMKRAMNELSNLIVTIQGDGDVDLARRLVREKGFIREELQSDLERLEELNIPVDIVFNQGPAVAGLR